MKPKVKVYLMLENLKQSMLLTINNIVFLSEGESGERFEAKQLRLKEELLDTISSIQKVVEDEI